MKGVLCILRVTAGHAQVGGSTYGCMWGGCGCYCRFGNCSPYIPPLSVFSNQLLWAGSERCKWCKGRQHQGHEKCSHQPDYSQRTISEPSHSSECQMWSWLQPWTHWCTFVSSWPQLNKFWVHVRMAPYCDWSNIRTPGRGQNLSTARYKFQAISGQYYYMQTMHTILKICGMACYEVACLCQWAQ